MTVPDYSLVYGLGLYIALYSFHLSRELSPCQYFIICRLVWKTFQRRKEEEEEEVLNQPIRMSCQAGSVTMGSVLKIFVYLALLGKYVYVIGS